MDSLLKIESLKKYYGKDSGRIDYDRECKEK